jgi:WG containing repeat
MQSRCFSRRPVQPASTGGDSLTPTQQGSQWGYANSTGKFVIAPQFSCVDNFSEGLAAVKFHGRYGFIGSNGHFAIPPKYYVVDAFKEGFALVCVNRPLTPLGPSEEVGIALFERCTYIDRVGRQIRPPLSVRDANDFSQGLAAVMPGAMVGSCGKGGYLNTKGQWAIKPQFGGLRDFSEGLAAVSLETECVLGSKWGYIDKQGALVIPYQFDAADQFRNGRACARVDKQWMLVDTNGKTAPVDEEKCADWEYGPATASSRPH